MQQLHMIKKCFFSISSCKPDCALKLKLILIQSALNANNEVDFLLEKRCFTKIINSICLDDGFVCLYFVENMIHFFGY